MRIVFAATFCRATMFLAASIGAVPLAAAVPAAGDQAPRSTPHAEAFVDAMLEQLATTAPGVDVPALCFAPDTPRDYAADVNARLRAYSQLPFAAPVFGRQRLTTRWSATASDGFGLSQGDPTTLTWSYVPDGTLIIGFAGEATSVSQLFAWLGGIYGDFATWHALFQQVFDRWSALTGFTYVYEPNDDGIGFGSSPGVLGLRGDVRIGAHPIDGNSGILAYNFFPDNGDMVLDAFDTFYDNTSNGSLRMRNVLAHEHGHGMGLSHVCPIDQTKLMEPFLTTAFDGPQFDDVLGAQRGYGDFTEHNDSAANAVDLGAGSATITEISIDDGGGEDWYRFTAIAGATVGVTVTPSGSPYLEGPQNNDGSCSAGTTFDPRDELDLAVEVLAGNGTTVLAAANATAAGGSESLSGVALGVAGSYYLRVFNGDAIDRIQRYRLQLTLSGGSALFSDGFESGDTAAWVQTVP